MRKFIFYISLCLTLQGCKEKVLASLNVKIEMEDKNNFLNPDIHYLKLYKDGALFKDLKRENFPFIEHNFKLDSLSSGKYSFEYYNIFGDIIKKNILIKSSKEYNISIFPDSSNYKKFESKSFVKTMENGEVLKINGKMVGCFMSGQDSLQISKSNNVYTLTHHNKIIKLKKTDLDYIIKFECELFLLLGINQCTTSETYSFIMGTKTKKITDDTCRNGGWSRIIHYIDKKNGL